MSGAGAGNIVKRQEKAFFVWGRFQPPTIGHERLFDELAAAAEAEEADAYVFVTSTRDNKKNPLTVYQKLAYIHEMFPDERRITFINTTDMNCKTIPEAAHLLVDSGYAHLELFAGSDRYDDYVGLASEYPDLKIAAVHPLTRDPDVDELIKSPTSISGTNVRTYALAGNIERVRAGLPASTRRTNLAERLAANIVHGIQVKLPKPEKPAKAAKPAESAEAAKPEKSAKASVKKSKKTLKKSKKRSRSKSR
jgi:hypothetical protein